MAHHFAFKFADGITPYGFTATLVNAINKYIYPFIPVFTESVKGCEPFLKSACDIKHLFNLLLRCFVTHHEMGSE